MVGMKLLSTLFSSLLFISVSFGQVAEVNGNNTISKPDTAVYSFPPTYALPAEGLKAQVDGISEEIKSNHADLLGNESEGKVYVKFIIEKDGTASHAEVVKTFNERLNQVVTREIEKLDGFVPGKDLNENPVRSYYTLPIEFKL